MNKRGLLEIVFLIMTILFLLTGCSNKERNISEKSIHEVETEIKDATDIDNNSIKTNDDLNVESGDYTDTDNDSNVDKTATPELTPTATPIPEPLDYMYSKKEYVNGQLTHTWISDEKGNVKYHSQVDSFGREKVTIKTEYVNGDCVTHWFYYGDDVTETKNEYDSNHNLIKKTVNDPTYPEPAVYTYKYDSQNRTIEINTKSFGVTTKETYVYDGEGRELKYQSESSGGWILIKETKYNSEGKKTLYTETNKGPNVNTESRQEYEYDSDGMLVRWTGYFDGEKTSEYIADKNGHKSYSQNYGGLYLSEEESIFDDENGNRAEVTYKYDNEGRLIGISTHTSYKPGNYYFDGLECFYSNKYESYDDMNGDSESYGLEGGKNISISYYRSGYTSNYYEGYQDLETGKKKRSLSQQYYDGGILKSSTETNYDDHGNVLETIEKDGNGQTTRTVRYEYEYKLIGSN